MTASGSRLELVRRRLRVARWGIAAVAATGFAGFVFAARAAHPGSSTAANAGNASQASYRDDDGYDSDDDSGQSFSFDDGSIGQGSGTPSIQSSGS
jgi:hypothetical protein